MEIEIAAFGPSWKAQVLGLSLRAWDPVFSKLQPAVQGYVYEAFYPRGWRARQASDIEGFLDAEGGRAWVAVRGGVVLGWVGVRPQDAERPSGCAIRRGATPARQRAAWRPSREEQSAARPISASP